VLLFLISGIVLVALKPPSLRITGGVVPLAVRCRLCATQDFLTRLYINCLLVAS
jgi:hypothetical protein